MLDPVINFGKVTVSTGFNSAATSITLVSGHGARLPSASSGDSTTHYNIVCWNDTDYNAPADAYHSSEAEIMRVTNRATDVLTVTRAQEGTTARNFNTGGKTYKIIQCFTKKMMDDIRLAGFSVHKNGTNQTGVATGTWTKVTWPTEIYDTNSEFANDKWTPSARIVQITAGITWIALGDGVTGIIALYKNGTLFKYGNIIKVGGTVNLHCGGSWEDNANGTDDYEIYIFHNHGSDRDIEGSSTYSFFMGK
ncbi:MAG: hypothetical protein GY774_16590 [Planctomycetes bacterium]|nr:hypothetical protein [Planctomycetota bacterium]